LKNFGIGAESESEKVTLATSAGLLLLPTGPGVSFSLLQLDPGWILFLLKKRHWLFV